MLDECSLNPEGDETLPSHLAQIGLTIELTTQAFEMNSPLKVKGS